MKQLKIIMILIVVVFSLKSCVRPQKQTELIKVDNYIKEEKQDKIKLTIELTIDRGKKEKE